MKKLERGTVALIAGLALVIAAPASAQGKSETVVGVFLPASVSDGQERLKIAETLAAKLAEATGASVSGRSFGRFEDFSQALSSGAISLGLIDGWVAGQLPAAIDPVAVGNGPVEKHRLVLVAPEKGTVPSLKGRRLAVVRGAAGLEAKFLSHVLFAGDLQAHKHFKLVPVPNTESALQALEAGAADAAMVLNASATGLELAYAGPAFPATYFVKGRKALPQGMQQALLKLSVGPAERVSAARGDELDALRTLTVRGPPRRTPAMADSGTERFDPALVDSAKLGLALPAFTATVALPEETPDD